MDHIEAEISFPKKKKARWPWGHRARCHVGSMQGSIPEATRRRQIIIFYPQPGGKIRISVLIQEASSATEAIRALIGWISANTACSAMPMDIAVGTADSPPE